MTYIHLADDLSKLIETYPENPLISENQRAIWRPKGRQKAITHGMLGGSHSCALRLLEEDGFNGQPVGSLSPRSAESFWYYNDNHIFPPKDDLIRFALFMHLDLYRALALVLKGEWEEFFAREICQWTANVGRSLSDVLKDEDAMGEALSRFNPNSKDLFARFLTHACIDLGTASNKGLQRSNETHSLAELTAELVGRASDAGIGWLVESGYTVDTFDTLVQTMLLGKLHWAATDSPEIEHFKRESLEEIVLAVQGTEEERQRYWSLTQARIHILMDLDETYLQIDSTRLQNEATRYRYLGVFGQHELSLREAKDRYHELEQKLLLKHEDPDLTREGLDELIAQMIEEMEKERKELEDKARFAVALGDNELFLDALGQGGAGGTPVDLSSYQAKCKAILRKIFLLIHPDRLQNDEAYEKLTPEQREELQRILEECLKIKVTDLGVPGRYIESRYRTPAALQEVLDRVRFILENAGINADPRIDIQGDTLPERLIWLQEDIDRLHAYHNSATVTLQMLMSDEEVQQKRAILANESSHAEIKDEMEKQTGEYRKQADELEAELEELMGGDTR